MSVFQAARKVLFGEDLCILNYIHFQQEQGYQKGFPKKDIGSKLENKWHFICTMVDRENIS